MPESVAVADHWCPAEASLEVLQEETASPSLANLQVLGDTTDSSEYLWRVQHGSAVQAMVPVESRGFKRL